MTTHGMIDLETLGTAQNTVVLSLGAVKFDPFNNLDPTHALYIDILWCQGPLFDYAILEDFYRNMQQPCPWHYWQIRDSRTLFALMPRDPRKDIQQELHNALADAYFQAQCVQKTYKHFNITTGQ